VGENQYRCASDLSLDLGFANAELPFSRLLRSTAEQLRNQYQVVYVAPGLGTGDYSALQQLVAPGGVIEQFVSLGGVAVIDVAGTSGDQLNVAPGGVGFASVAEHEGESILLPEHTYFTGLGMGGEPLSEADFSGWQPTDHGTLTNLPVDATVLLDNGDGPSLAEYPYAAGRVIVTTLSYCWTGKPNSDGAPARNLLKYSRFYSGSAQTPAPTVTSTFTPTVTPTRTITNTPRATATATGTRTPTLTPVVLLGDVNGDGVVDGQDVSDLIAAIFFDADVPDIEPNPYDVNRDGGVTAADVTALLLLMGTT
jgi:hypothetical protein